ncbi:MAG TPA: restriction endonuclease subunit S, partial [Phycisphaerales bacterium]|nr:restriction endonuclease subunit S [Phycisphaerales bacterium]
MSIAPAATDISAKAVPAEEEAPENTKVTGAWFNRVPPGWQAAPIKRLFRLVNGATPAADEATYWGGEIAWATPDDLGSLTGSRLRTTARTLSRDGYANCGASIVPAESLVLSTRAPIGHVAIADGPMCTNQGCRSLVAWRPVSATYFYYQLLAARPLLESLGNGSTFKELRGSELGRVVVALPPLPEQRAIATFLDERTRRIDELIEKKRRLLALLDEQRTALITRAVTKGLNPDAPMKPSGIDWLGDVPRHWSVTGLKRLCSGWCDGPFGSSLKSEHYTEHGVRVVRLQNIGEGEFNAGDAAYIGEDYYSILGDHDVEAGDVLVAGLGDNAHPVG